MALTELLLLAFSMGALNSWKETGDQFSEVLVEIDSDVDSPLETKSLYDLMAHFPTDKDITCPGSDSRFRYPGECNRYVTCRNYKAHIRHCPPGMSFDQKYEHCRLSFEVDCMERPKLQATCGSNEVYSDCGCETPCSFEEDRKCEVTCLKGCFCRSGFYRDSAGNCVTADGCEDKNDLFDIFRSHRDSDRRYESNSFEEEEP